MRRILIINVLLLSGCGLNSPPPAPLPPSLQVLESGDTVQALLQDRVRSKLNTQRDDFQVFVTDFAYPIGTVIPEGRTIGVSQTACKPKVDPGTFQAANLFPTIAMRSTAAFDVGLDAAAIPKIAELGANVGQESVVNLSVADVSGQFLLDDELRQTVGQASCSALLLGQSYLVVRGYISGKRSFLLQRDNTKTFKVGIAKIGHLNVEAPSSTAVSLTEDAPTKFLQIVSKISVPLGVNFTASALVSDPAVPVGTGRVYVQRDVNDPATNAAAIRDLLSTHSFNVVPAVEAIESAKVPSVAQVRYFNRTDAALAQKAAGLLRQRYPDATTLFVGLRAPAGQLEVWLPRTGS